MPRIVRNLNVTFLTLSALACGSSPTPEAPDAASVADAAPADSGFADAEPSDAGPGDASVEDAGTPPEVPRWRSITGAPPSTPRGRWGAVLVEDSARGRLILHGGSHYPDGTADDTWAFDPEQGIWTELTTTNPPPSRFCHCGAYLPETNELLVINGRDEGGPVERAAFTLSFDSLEWTRVPGPAPAGLVGCSAIHDPVRSRVVIFGGATTSGFSNATSVYDPIERVFISLAPETSPSPRRDASMVYDSASDRMLLFGGQTGRSSHANDVWAFDGTEWQALPAEGAPPARRWAASALDDRGQWFIYGGTNEVESFGDLWRLDLETASFEPQDLEGTPIGRAGTAHVFVPEAGALFLFGGFDASTYAKFEDGWALSL